MAAGSLEPGEVIATGLPERLKALAHAWFDHALMPSIRFADDPIAWRECLITGVELQICAERLEQRLKAALDR